MPEMQQECLLHIQPKKRHLSAVNQSAEVIANIVKSYLQVLFHFWYHVNVWKELVSCILDIFNFNFFRSVRIFNFAVGIQVCKVEDAMSPGLWQWHDYHY